MTLLPIIGLVMVVTGIWGIRLIIDPTPLSAPAGALLGAEVFLVGSVASSGLLLARAAWSHRLLLGFLFATLGVAARLQFTVWSVIGICLALTAIGLASSPLLTVHLRRLPPAEPLPPASLALALGLLAVPAVVALTARPTATGWAYSLAAVAVDWGYTRAMRVGLYGARLLIPGLAVWAGATTPGGIWIAASGIGLGVIAFHPGAGMATRTLLPPSRPTRHRP